MFVSPPFLSVTVASIVTTTTTAFTSPSGRGIVQRSPCSSGRSRPSFVHFNGNIPEPEMLELSLKSDTTQQHTAYYILKHLVDIIDGMTYEEAYDVFWHSNGIAKLGFIDEYPREVAERYFKEFTDKGINILVA